MKTPVRSSITFLALALFAGWSGVRANPVHSGSYTVTIGSGQMGFSPDGDYASFGLGVSPWANPNSTEYFFPFEWWGNGWQYLVLERSLSAVFQADPGKIFDKVYVGLVPGAVRTHEGLAYAESNWTINGGTYHGDTSYYFGDPIEYHDYNITSPSSGESTMYYAHGYSGVYSTWGGFWGTPEYLNGYYDIGASSFSLDLSILAMTANGAGFNPPGLQFHFTYLDAPAPGSSVPESGDTMLLLLSGLAGLAWSRRPGMAGKPVSRAETRPSAASAAIDRDLNR